MVVALVVRRRGVVDVALGVVTTGIDVVVVVVVGEVEREGTRTDGQLVCLFVVPLGLLDPLLLQLDHHLAIVDVVGVLVSVAGSGLGMMTGGGCCLVESLLRVAHCDDASSAHLGASRAKSVIHIVVTV